MSMYCNPIGHDSRFVSFRMIGFSNSDEKIIFEVRSFSIYWYIHNFVWFNVLHTVFTSFVSDQRLKTLMSGRPLENRPIKGTVVEKHE